MANRLASRRASQRPHVFIRKKNYCMKQIQLHYESDFDLFRELCIFIVIFVLLIQSIKLKSLLSAVIFISMILGHLAMLLANYDIFSHDVVLIGATVLATNAYQFKYQYIAFAGTYSIMSKFRYFHLNGAVLEIFKFVASILVTVTILQLLKGRFPTYLRKQFKKKQLLNLKVGHREVLPVYRKDSIEVLKKAKEI